MSKLFYNDDVVSRNLNFEKMDTASYTGKNDGVWLLWGIFKEKTKYYGSVKKSKCPFSCHLKIDKKLDNVNNVIDPKRKN